MKPASSGNNTTFISRLAIASIAGALAITSLGFVAAPAVRAEIPPDQIKAAGSIPLTTDLLDKMDKFLKAASADDAAKAELAVIGKDPTMTPEKWGSEVTAKCPKTAEIFKSTGITPDDFSKGIFAIMACAMGDELAKSEDKAVKANYDFVNANKDRAGAIFGSFMTLGEPGAAPPTP
jgi:hypothetical protein